MRQNHIQSKNAKLFRKLLTAIQTARCSQNLLRRMKTAASLSWARPHSETRKTIVRRLPSFNRANDAFAGLPRFGKNQPPTRQLLSSQRAGLKSEPGRFCVMDASLCIQSVPKG
jgi:hypothetical protein